MVLRCLLVMGEVEAGLGGGRSQTESALAPSEGALASGLASPGKSSAPGGLNGPFLKVHRFSAESSSQGHLTAWRWRPQVQ